MNLDRRSWLYLAGATLCGCKSRQSSLPRQRQETEVSENFVRAGAQVDSSPKMPAKLTKTRLQAGSFSVEVLPGWQDRARVRKIPARPLYAPGEWHQVQAGERDGILTAFLKPHFGNRPEHWAIELPAALPSGIKVEPTDDGDNPTAPQILIHKADGWSAIFRDGTDGRDTSPEILKAMRDRMDAVIRGSDVDPVPAEMDGALVFPCLKKRLDFDGGHGVRLIAQWAIEPDLMRKGLLHYLFVGMSDDDTCQIIATFPINLGGVPKEGRDAEHLGKSTSRHQELSQGFDSYQRDAVAWLEKHANSIDPGLNHLDEMLQSLVVRRWE